MFREQLSDDEEDIRIIAVEGETAGICHHAAIHGDGKMFGGFGEEPQLPGQAEHQFAGRRGLRNRDGERILDIRIQMVVDEHLLCLG